MLGKRWANLQGGLYVEKHGMKNAPADTVE